MNSFIKLTLLIVLPLIQFSSVAYIPTAKMVLSRTAENHGKGFYLLEFDVVLPREPEPIIIRESWIIKDGESLRMKAFGKKDLAQKFSLTVIYDGNQKAFVDEDGSRQVAKTPEDFFEPYFNFRFSQRIKTRLVAQGIIPATELDKKVVKKELTEEPMVEEQPFMRLSRIGGVVTWAMGEPSPQGDADALPGLWIEQDLFRVRKIRHKSQAESIAEYIGKKWWPTSRKITWGDKTAHISNVKIKNLPSTSKTKALLRFKSLNASKDPTVKMVMPDDPVIQEFYQRFR